VNGKPVTSPSIAALRETVEEAVKKMNSIKPASNSDEFEHFRLMLDIRLHYLRFREAESRFNSTDFSIDDRKSVITELEKLIQETKDLDRRFARLNRGFLHESEIEHQNMIRNRKLILLHRRLTGRRTP